MQHSISRIIWILLLFVLAIEVVKAAPNDAANNLPVIRSLAQKNYPKAQFILGLMYFSGQGVQQNYSEAQTWFRKAADQHDRDASYFLGSIYSGALGVQQDPVQAAHWYLMAAEQGHAGAQTEIGLRYLTGNGVAASDAIAGR